MGLVDSVKRSLGLVCWLCASEQRDFRCALCRRKFCRACAVQATAITRASLESSRSEALLAKGILAGEDFNVYNKVLDRINLDRNRECCPRCVDKYQQMPSCEPIAR
jgi:hypothetical protein